MSDHNYLLETFKEDRIKANGQTQYPDTPLPDFILNPNPDKMGEAALIENPEFQEQARIMYTETMRASYLHYLNQTEAYKAANELDDGYLDDPADIARWAIADVTWSRHNDVRWFLNIGKMKNANPDLLVAWANVDNMYEQTPDLATGDFSSESWKQFGRGAIKGLLSPSTLFGGSIIAKAAFGKVVTQSMRSVLHSAAKQAVKSEIGRRRATKALKFTGVAAIGAAEGAAYSVGSARTNESLDIYASGASSLDQPISRDPEITRQAARDGAAMGALLVGGGAAIGLAAKGSIALAQKFLVKRGEAVGGNAGSPNNTFVDSDAAAMNFAAKHGDGQVRDVEVSANHPVAIEKERVTAQDLSEAIGVHISDEVATAIRQEIKLANQGKDADPRDLEFPDTVLTSDALNTPTLTKILTDNGVDLVAYSEKNVSDEEMRTLMGAVDGFHLDPKDLLYRGMREENDNEKLIGTQWASPNPDLAGAYSKDFFDNVYTEGSNVLPVVMKHKNLFNTADHGIKDGSLEVVTSEKLKSLIKATLPEGEETKLDQILSGLDGKSKRAMHEWWGEPSVVEALQGAGFDGIKSTQGRGKNSIPIQGVFDPKHMKSKFAKFATPTAMMVAADIGAKELDDEDASLDRSGVSTSYKVFDQSKMVNLGTRKYKEGVPNFVDRYMNPSKHPFMSNEDGSKSTHRMMQSGNITYPSIIQNDKGKLESLEPDDALNYANATGEFELHADENTASEWAMGKYKSVSNEPQAFEK
jgi:hypothetical protein